jgi:hypothetical protein
MRSQHVVSGWQRLWTSALVGALLVPLMTPLTALAGADVAVQSVASVQGTVTKSGTTQPIEGASVSARNGDGETVASDSTDATGHYMLDLPGPGTYEIGVEAERYEPQRRTVVYGGSPQGQDFALVAQVKWLFGNVTNADTGQPLANAYVQASLGFDTYLALTDAQGDYELWVGPTPRTYTVQVGKSGYHTQTSPNNLFDGSSQLERNYELEPKAPGVYGRVTESGSGDPLLNATVTVSSSGGTVVQVFSDQNGEYEALLASSGTYNITAAKEGHKPVSGSFSYNGVDSVLKDFALVTNATPVAEDQAYSTPINSSLPVAAPGMLEGATDDDGDTLTASEVSEPGNGSLVYAPDGSFTYTPDPDFEGVDTFTYRAYDGSEYSDAATVSITVGSPPVTLTIEQHDAGVTFDRFVTGASPAYSGGGYIYGHGKWAGTKLQVRFTGSAIRWYGPKQPVYGMADVYVDGQWKAQVDCYASDEDKTLNALLVQVDGLTDTAHTLEIRPKVRTATDGSIVVIDYFQVDGAAPKGGGKRLNESGAHAMFSGPWIYATNSAYIADSYRYSRYANAIYTATFNGTKVAWIGPRTGQYGRAKVYIDGALQGTVSQYGATGWRHRVWESKTLPVGNHTIKIVPTGTKDAVSKSTNIVIDALDVTP